MAKKQASSAKAELAEDYRDVAKDKAMKSKKSKKKGK